MVIDKLMLDRYSIVHWKKGTLYRIEWAVQMMVAQMRRGLTV